LMNLQIAAPNGEEFRLYWCRAETLRSSREHFCPLHIRVPIQPTFQQRVFRPSNHAIIWSSQR
jgi:hypothetical protein